MKPFLEELAETIIAQHPRLEELTMVFPNRRAALFFHHYLSQHLSKPAWSPQLKTIEELFHELSPLQEADRLSLIFKLFGVYRKVMNNEETFDQFYFWGDMLLRDFEEVDKYLISAPQLFKDLSQLRELDESFDYLTEEQKKFLKDFWLNFQEKPSGSKDEFLKVWRELPVVYHDFTRALRSQKLGYEGMIQRDVAERILAGKVSSKPKSGAAKVVFAGFNALTRAEEVLITHFISEGAQAFWDVDDYYVNNASQEAGQFFRLYKKHPALGPTFGSGIASHFSGEKSVDLFGVPQKVGQAKLLGQCLHNDLAGTVKSVDKMEALRTVVVLPDESLLLPVMHSLPGDLESVNVTMGYPLTNTPLFNLLELLMELQINRSGDAFSHRQVTAILAHAYILSQEPSLATRTRLEIIERNRVYVSSQELHQGKGLLELVFQPVDADGIAAYLLRIVQTLGAAFTDKQSFDREYAYHFHRHLSRLYEVLTESGAPLDLKGFQKLFRQVIKSQKIPFTGEPLKGLQIMGVLETRNLDFDNVYILSLNEGSLPAAPRHGSYIPHTIRKAYGLPLYDHQDAMYAYLFYRVLQRAKNIRLFYNTEPDVLGTGEMSRFLQQLIHESGWKIKHHILRNPIGITEVKPIDVAKTPGVLAALEKYCDPEGSGISPTALNDYIECSLRFYLKYIARLEEAKDVEEEIDARVFGTILHDVMEAFYRELTTQKQSIEVLEQDLRPDNAGALLDRLIDQAFRERYGQGAKQKMEYQGQRVVVRAVVRQFAQRIVDLDRDYAPFEVELLEKKFKASLKIESAGPTKTVLVSGRVDRIDKKDRTVRVIDYKTGKDELTMESIASLFAREGKRNKAAFQTFLYAWLYSKNEKTEGAVIPMLMNRKNLFKEDVLKPFSMAKRPVTDIGPYLNEFEERLQQILQQLYDPDVLFTQTQEEKNCIYCLFKNMCRR